MNRLRGTVWLSFNSVESILETQFSQLPSNVLGVLSTMSKLSVPNIHYINLRSVNTICISINQTCHNRDSNSPENEFE